MYVRLPDNDTSDKAAEAAPHIIALNGGVGGPVACYFNVAYSINTRLNREDI